MIVKPYITNRVRQEPPCPRVVSGSTPVLAFGDPFTARTASVGLNPSQAEFLNGDQLLDGAARRLATLRSLELDRLSEASDRQVEDVVRDCANYFLRNPYRRWFDQLEPMMNAVGASYYDGSACHLDLVQWATKPIWKSLTHAERQLLLMADVPFLLSQLQEEEIQLVLLNGRGVVRHFERHLGLRLEEAKIITDWGHHSTRVFTGELLGRVRVVGWSTNLQSSHGVTRERRRLLAECIGSLTAS